MMTLYLRRAWDDHLSDTTTYRRLSDDELARRLGCVKRLYICFLDRFFPRKSDDRTYLVRSFDKNAGMLPYFFIVAKIHKDPWTTRPIISTCGSYVEGIGRWADKQLQKLVKLLPYVASSSYQVLQQLTSLPPLPPGAKLFAADARWIYTNIDTMHALRAIKDYVERRPDLCTTAGVNGDALHAALNIIMSHNVFTFGDTNWVQLTGTAMGTAPGPAYATLYFAIHEATFNYPELLAYWRYIDDVIGIWLPRRLFDDAIWSSFQRRMDAFGKLRWDFSTRSDSATYLDMELSIVDGRIRSRCVDRILNLHLYIPPHSAHRRGILQAQISGTVLRITRLTTDPADRHETLRMFRRRLLRRGYTAATLDPLFRTELRAVTLSAPPTRVPVVNTLYLHVQYHPLDIKRAGIQQAFRRTVACHRDGVALPDILNHNREHFNVDRTIVAYHRPRNLRDLVARNRAIGPGLIVSAAFNGYLDGNDAGNPNPNPTHRTHI